MGRFATRKRGGEKLQIPSVQAPEKSQIPSSRHGIDVSVSVLWRLDIGASLELGVWDLELSSPLSFWQPALFSIHADIRIPLREMREGQRDSGAFERLEGRQMPRMRLDEAGKEILHFRVSECGGKCAGRAKTRWRWLRAGVRVSLSAT